MEHVVNHLRKKNRSFQRNVSDVHIIKGIREFGYNLKTTPIVFVGGGAVVMKNFGSHDAKNISYNLDVKANARGYEQLATMGLKSTKRLS